MAKNVKRYSDLSKANARIAELESEVASLERMIEDAGEDRRWE